MDFSCLVIKISYRISIVNYYFSEMITIECTGILINHHLVLKSVFFSYNFLNKNSQFAQYPSNNTITPRFGVPFCARASRLLPFENQTKIIFDTEHQ